MAGDEESGSACARLRAYGVVQGVGFRPFVCNAARALKLGGHVRNAGTHMEAVACGPRHDIELLAEKMRCGPSRASVERVDVEYGKFEVGDEFTIAESVADGREGFIPPDLATCSACLDEIDGSGRYRDYWATSCVDCGPRWTVLSKLPYDRRHTALRDFPLCPDCLREYAKTEDRRFHAQSINCPACGPQLRLLGAPDGGDPIAATARLITEGRVVAVKGLGGFHIACNFERIPFLRSRVNRPHQPFAAMATMEMLEELCEPLEKHGELLQSPAAPIVLIPKKDREIRAMDDLAPGLDSAGFMLPYTGLHHLLFRHLDEPIVFTSANLPHEPMLTETADVEKMGIQYVLDHDRPIVNRCDDSVVRVTGGRTAVIRFARGLGPRYFNVDVDSPHDVIALGAEMYSTVALYSRGRVLLSHHLGRLTNPRSYENFRDSISTLLEMTRTRPSIVACDLHPDYLSTVHARRMAGELGVRLVQVQHHLAHIAHLDCDAGIAVDGVGYGEDGTVWGGEVFLGDEWVGGLQQHPMPGGDAATAEPLRMVLGILGDVEVVMPPDEKRLVLRQVEKRVNAPLTSSAGRVLDAAAGILGVCLDATYEGQPAIMLEAAARGGTPARLPIEIEGNRLLTEPMLRRMYELRDREPVRDLARGIQDALGRGLALIALKHPGKRVGLSGGVSYNEYVTSAVRKEVEASGRELVTPEGIPRGDGGVSFGQAVYVARTVTGNQSRPHPAAR